jgi:hypothetical protein
MMLSTVNSAAHKTIRRIEFNMAHLLSGRSAGVGIRMPLDTSA